MNRKDYEAKVNCLESVIEDRKVKWMGFVRLEALALSNYEQERDEVLIERIREGDNNAVNAILIKYKGLVLSKAKSMYILGADTEDLIQEGMIGLFKAICDYDFGRDASFFTFAELCINRQIYTAVQASQRKKHAPLNTYISLYSEMEGEDGSKGKSLSDTLQAGQNTEPEKVFLDKERVEYLENAIDEELSDFEKQVFDLYLTGMTYSEIAKVLQKGEKSTDNALQRIKGKIRKILEN